MDNRRSMSSIVIQPVHQRRRLELQSTMMMTNSSSTTRRTMTNNRPTMSMHKRQNKRRRQQQRRRQLTTSTSMTLLVFPASITLFVLLLFQCPQIEAAATTIPEAAVPAYPAYRTPPLDYSVRYRQNVCDRVDAFLRNGTVALPDALRGMELRPHLASGIGELTPVQADGIVPVHAKHPVIRILDELAVRAGFTWRQSYASSGLADIQDMDAAVDATEDGTIDFDDVLQWSIETFDFVATDYQKSLERTTLGASFLEGYLDSSIIMVAMKPESKASFDLFGFLGPFDWQVWLLIVGTMLVAGLVYQWMEWINEDSDRQDLQKKPTETMYFAALSFNGDIKFQPSTDYARLFVLTLAFWGLILSSAYTANLASFLVVQNTPVLHIESLGEAVALNLPICAVDGTAPMGEVLEDYPLAKLVAVNNTNPSDIFRRVADGTCAIAITTWWQWDIAQRDRTVNGDCQLQWIGRVFKFAKSGFVTLSDSGILCSNLIRDVLSVHISAMLDDGTVTEITDEYLASIETINCQAEADASGDSSATDGSGGGSDSIQALGLKDLGGLFIIIYSIGAVCCIMAIATWLIKKRRPTRKSMKMEYKQELNQHADVLNDLNSLSLQEDQAVVPDHDPHQMLVGNTRDLLAGKLDTMRSELEAMQALIKKKGI